MAATSEGFVPANTTGQRIGHNPKTERAHRGNLVQLLWTRWFRNVEELLEALHEWVQTYNEQWMVEKHEHRSPSEIRAHLAETREAA